MWGGYRGPGDIEQATVKPVGERWGPTITISEDNSSDPQVAMNAAGDATAVWTRYIGCRLWQLHRAGGAVHALDRVHDRSAAEARKRTHVHKGALNAKAGETVDYEIKVKDTGSTTLEIRGAEGQRVRTHQPRRAHRTRNQPGRDVHLHAQTRRVRHVRRRSLIEADKGTGTRTSNSVAVALAPVFEASAGAATRPAELVLKHASRCSRARTCVRRWHTRMPIQDRR